MIVIKLRDGTINIPYKYFEKYLDIDWFFSNLIKYSFNGGSHGNDGIEGIEKKNDIKDTIIEIFESKNAVLSIFDSLRFNKLVVHSDVSLDYLYSLVDYWCGPEWIKEEIEKRRINEEYKEVNKKTDMIITLENYIFKCINCYGGFKLSENYLDSCKRHSTHISHTTMIHSCCGGGIDSDKCLLGYHIPPYNYMELFNNSNELFNRSNENNYENNEIDVIN